jgi:UDP-N-acetyl-D-mannosaminuronic acid dehydrogenase
MSKNTELKVAILGLGHVGLPLAALLAVRGIRVLGFDINSNMIADLKKGNLILWEPGLNSLLKRALKTNAFAVSDSETDLEQSNVFVVTVGTPWDENRSMPDSSQLDSALRVVGERMRKGSTIILKSTVAPGTCDEFVIPLLEKVSGLRVIKDFGVVFSPERMIEGRAIEDFQTLPKIIGATDDKSYNVALSVLKVLGGSIQRVSSVRTAEMVKMLDNYNRDGSIALINQFALFCEAANVDVIEVIKSAKSGYERNSGILIPGGGVGGSCLNKDPWLLDYFSKQKGIESNFIYTLRWRNSSMPLETARLANLIASRLKVKRPSILIAGLAFKSETDDTRFSPALAIRAALSNSASRIVLTDPYVKSLKEYSIQAPVISDIYAAAKGTNIAIFATDHLEYRNIDLRRLRNLMSQKRGIVDSRHVVDPRRAIALGFDFEGIGRPKGAFV